MNQLTDTGENSKIVHRRTQVAQKCAQHQDALMRPHNIKNRKVSFARKSYKNRFRRKILGNVRKVGVW